MKRIVLVTLACIISSMSYAQMNATFSKERKAQEKVYKQKLQAVVDSIKNSDPNIFFVETGNLNVKDKVFITNKSSYFIQQAMVGFINDHLNFEIIGTFSSLNSGSKTELLSFNDNNLRKIRNKTLVLKIKGSKDIQGQEDGESEPSNTDLLKDTTYDFSVNLSENRHDLYIDIIHNKGDMILDF